MSRRHPNTDFLTLATAGLLVLVLSGCSGGSGRSSLPTGVSNPAATPANTGADDGTVDQGGANNDNPPGDNRGGKGADDPPGHA
jgi:hypothetical protein